MDGRVEPGYDDPNCGLRIFVAEDTPRRTAPRIGRDLIQQYQHLNRSHFHTRCCFATWAASCSRKGRQPVTPTDGVGAVPAGGGSSLPLPGGPGIDPAGITTGA